MGTRASSPPCPGHDRVLRSPLLVRPRRRPVRLRQEQAALRECEDEITKFRRVAQVDEGRPQPTGIENDPRTEPLALP